MHTDRQALGFCYKQKHREVKQRNEDNTKENKWVSVLSFPKEKYLYLTKPEGLLPQELASVIVRPLLVISEKLWQSTEVPEDYRKAKVTPSFRKDKKDHLGNYRPASLTLIPGQVMELEIRTGR